MQHTRTVRRSSSLGAALVVLAGLIAACGSSGPSGGFGSGEQFSISAALRQIPLSSAAGESGLIEVYVADLLAASEATGVSRPTGSTDDREVFDWVGPMMGFEGGETVFLPSGQILPGDLTPVAGYREEIGFAVTEVDAVVESALGTDSITVLAGDVQASATVEVTSGVLTFGEGADFEVDLGARTVARRLGRPLRTASAQGLLLLTRSTDAALSWLDDTSARLDSDQDFALAATILDERDLISAALWRTDFTADVEDSSDLPITTPFNTLAVGWGVVDGEASITVVYVTADDSAAVAAAEQVAEAFSAAEEPTSHRPMSDLVTIDEVTVQDRAVVVSLSLPAGQGPGVVMTMFLRRQLPFVYAS